MKRRELLGAGAVFGLGACASAPPHAIPTPRIKPATFLLVHGAWHGGWCWRDVGAILHAAGHRVLTPTLTGLADRKHLLSAEVGLETHIADVVNLIDAEELSDVVLAGHSYGGMVITGVADQRKSQLRHIIYLDAALPDDGETMITQKPGITPGEAEATQAQMRTLAPDGLAFAVLPPALLGVPETDVAATAWLQRRLTPHPAKTWFDQIHLTHGGSSGLKRTYVWCNAPALEPSAFPAHAARIKNDPSWRYRELATGHELMITKPRETADLLLEAATA